MKRFSELTLNHHGSDKIFAGSIPELYDKHLVPLIFEPYAADLVKRLASRPLTRVLEIAAGTGVLTRAMASALPDNVSIVATDLNQPMLDHASSGGIFPHSGNCVLPGNTAAKRNRSPG